MMHFLKAALLIFALFLFPAVYGCGNEDRDTEAIKNSILWYDDALIRAYRDRDSEILFGKASAKEIGRVRMIISKFIGEKTFMESELKEIRFLRIDKKGNAAEVEAFERWRYRHLKEGTKEVALPWRDEEYRLLYKMVRSKEKWVVDSSKFVSGK